MNKTAKPSAHLILMLVTAGVNINLDAPHFVFDGDPRIPPPPPPPPYL